MRSTFLFGFVSTLLLNLLLSAQNTQRVPATPAAGPYPTSLYRMNDVSKSLNLTPDQVTRLNTLTDQTQAAHRANYTQLGTLGEAERFARQQELNQQYTTAWNKGAGDVLTDAQRTRYQQLNYQHGGFNSLYDPAAQKQLNLTPAQVRDLRTNADWSNQQLQDINRLGATDAAKGKQMYSDYWTQRQDRLNKFLTPDQQKTWATMSGDPYAFQPTFASPR